MSYTLKVAWSAKDALADSNIEKVVSGVDFNTEFAGIRDEMNNTLATLAGSSSQTFSATTASAGTNTTQVATTAYVQSEGYATTTVVDAAIDTDVATHAALRASSSVFGHAKIWVSGTTLNITTS